MCDNESITIAVNATAARESGALTILKQLLAGIENNAGNEKYIIFVPEGMGFADKDGRVGFVELDTKSWKNRLRWDAKGFKSWFNDRGINPDLIISLQNTGVRYDKNTPQIVYYHQPMPLEKYRWNPFKRSERLYFLYKNIYPFFVRRYLDRAAHVVVQRESMKKAFAAKFGYDENRICVFSPDMPVIDIGGVSKNAFGSDGNVHMVYVATPLVYKNHMLLVKAVEILRNEGKVDNLRIHLTCTQDLGLSFVKAIRNKGLLDIFVFEGIVPFAKILSFYNSADSLLFPSYIETYGLPLAEAASFGVPIICSDLPYAREVLDGYEGAQYVAYNDPQKWAEAIERHLIGQTTRRFAPMKHKEGSDWGKFIELCRETACKR